MNEADTPNSGSPDPFDDAIERLNAAVERVGQRMSRLTHRLDQAQADLGSVGDRDEDRARLAEALDQARAREAELLEAAQDTSEALGEAIEEIAKLQEGDR